MGKRKVLILGAHPDDIELGMGATVALLADLNCNFQVHIMSSADESLSAFFPPGTVVEESILALEYLGVNKKYISFHNFRVRNFSNQRQEILEELVAISREYSPDIVFSPAVTDVHQDHSALAMESRRAFKGTSLLHYELIWNSIDFQPNFYVTLDEKQWQKKQVALNRFKSQSQKTYFSPDFISAVGRVNGQIASSKFAEAFHVTRILAQ